MPGKIILLVDRKDMTEGEVLRFIEKICRSAGLSDGSYVLSYLRPGVLERLKDLKQESENKLVVVAFGSIVTQAFLPKTTLSQCVGLAHETDYGVVVPMAHPGSLLRGKMGAIEKAIQTLIKCRTYLEN